MENKIGKRHSKRQKEGLKDLIAMLPSGMVGVELGSFAGESAGIFAESVKFEKLYCIDPWECDDCVSRGAEADFDEVAKKHPVLVKCKGTLRDFYKDFPEVDFVYIDAQHDFLHTLEHVFNSLLILNGEGYLAGHDFQVGNFADLCRAVRIIFPKDRIYTFQDSSFLIRIHRTPLEWKTGVIE